MNGLFYEYYYNGGGVAAGDFNNDGFEDIYLISNLESNRLYINQGKLNFKDVTKTAGVGGASVFATGVTTVDINSDGLLDIYVCSSGKFKDPDKRRNELYVNIGTGKDGIPRFQESAAQYNLDIAEFSTQASFFDYDRDGDLDMFLINHDVDTYGDDKLEKYLNTQGELSGERLYRNNDGNYVDVTEETGIINNRLGYGLGLAVGDVNNDTWPDVYVSHDFSGKDHLYLNNQDGTFSEIVNEAMGHISFFSMGNDIADYNNDGWLDVMSVDMVSEDNYGIKTSMSGMNVQRFYDHVDLGLHHQYMFNTLQTNNGTINGKGPFFSETAQIAGISSTDWSWGPLFFDMDNDGLQDLFVSNGIKRDFRNNDFIEYHKEVRNELSKKKTIDKEAYINNMMTKMPTRKKSNYFFLNQGDLTFSKINERLGLDSLKTSANGAAFADLDNDGDIDIVVNNMDDYAQIYENNSNRINKDNFLKIRLKGPIGNTLGIGARVKIIMDDAVQMREQYLTRGFQSAISPTIHFGLGSAQDIQMLQVLWPDGSSQEINTVQPNQTLVLEYGNATKTDSHQSDDIPLFEDITDKILSHVHVENKFNDFERESLLPHKMSEQGPAVAVGDVNNDGLDDFFVGGSMGFAGTLYLQNNDGTFTSHGQIGLERESQYEDVGAAFFDADRDGDLDLYIVSGGNELKTDSEYYQDRIYINKEGVFTRSVQSLPKFTASGSRVKPFDFDSDGDLDLFIGGRQTPGKYPQPADSYLLENRSREDFVSFVDVTEKKAPHLQKVGMVTDAVWTDINQDKLIDLILVGEWMPITVMINQGGYFEDKTSSFGFAEETGWWYSIAASDFDKDGDIDLMGGNLGLNYKYKATQEEPFEIYAEDFDSSGDLDIVLGYYNGGDLFPLRGRQCTSEQMPFIKKKFESYDAFGKATLKEVYGERSLEKALHYAARTFASTYYLNEGDGIFKKTPLPMEAQLSSVNSILLDDFDEDGSPDIIMAGNLYGSEVETPRNDASYGLYLKVVKKGKSFKAVPMRTSGIVLKGEVKHLCQLNSTNNSKIVMVIKNDGEIQFLRFRSTHSEIAKL
ncbi:VCBS repeat-containing protein [Pricia sp. S334]|uniref:VCBS repeat-containing protein n=1 Tax=Pricia mediterranea TaxID=3076079 RepID=A0ABU3L400_9FLAO|nr:VCBS repeat-containing protein [Pricia sp. S334]MDT7828360.1 VCBS repeat-containing protein [Pricia sp. S334]